MVRSEKTKSLHWIQPWEDQNITLGGSLIRDDTYGWRGGKKINARRYPSWAWGG